jgi:uncharacterized protein (DUF1501 family)
MEMDMASRHAKLSSGSHLPNRRDFLQVGYVGALGLTLGGYFARQAAAAEKNGTTKDPSAHAKAQALIHIFMPGGMAHQESWDPKPYAPVEYRGPMNSIDTKIPGARVNEAFSRIAQIADKISICRSMTHGEAAHERGTHNMFTGYKPSPALLYPSMGSVVAHEYGPRNNLPPYVCIPSMPTNYAGSGYLSSAFGPFSLGADPANNGFRVQDLALPGGVDAERFGKRQRMLDAVDAHFAKVEKSDAVGAMDTFYQRAYALISSQKAREAFNIDAEPAKLRDEYGRNTAGARMLMARRLVEAGVRFVSLSYAGWDFHNNIESSRGQLTEFDQGFARLIRDLDERGLLDSTIVMVSSEFGRTPKINGNAGRDHWPKVFSIVLAGGGFKRGYIHGTSDATASEPENDPFQVEDMAHTIYHQLGIDAEKELVAPGPRPIEIVKDGVLVKDLIA